MKFFAVREQYTVFIRLLFKDDVTSCTDTKVDKVHIRVVLRVENVYISGRVRQVRLLFSGCYSWHGFSFKLLAGSLCGLVYLKKLSL